MLFAEAQGEKVLKEGRAAMKKAVCVGIDDYPAEEMDLAGCVNDARAWVDILTRMFGFGRADVRLILNGEATRRNMLAALDSLIAGAGRGDVCAFIYSGHGTWVPDKSPLDEAEGRDEALVPCEADFDRLIIDDDLRERLNLLSTATSFTFIADSCYSGTVTRLAPGPVKKLRFYPPPWEGEPRPPLRKRLVGFSEMEMGEIFLGAAADDEPAAEGEFKGVRRGAFSYFAVRALEEAGPDIIYEEWLSRIRRSLGAAGFTQTPQLEGRPENKKRKIFTSF